MSKTLNLAEGKILPVLLKFTVPILLSLLLQIAYGTVDLLVVGQFAEIGDVSGVTVGSQVMQTITSFCTGLSMGTTVMLGQYIGAGEAKKTTKTVGVSIAVFTLLAFVITIGLAIFHGEIAELMQTPAESMKQAADYLFVASIGAVFVVFYNLLGSIFRGIGDAKTPLITVSIACVCNILLDLLLVAGFKMGAMGAAIATVTAQGISVILSILLIRKRTLPFVFSTKTISFDWFYVKRLLLIGIPVALQGALVEMSFLVVTSIINVFGVVASAAVGIVYKIAGMIMVVPSAFMQSLSAFTAQNFGARQLHRAKKGLRYAMVLSMVAGVIMAYLAGFHGTLFIQLFTDNPETTQSAILYLQSYAIDTLLVTVLFSMTGYFNGCGKTTFVMLQSVLGAFLIRIPLAYLFSRLPETSLFIIGLATPSSTILQIIACGIYYAHCQKKLTTLQ